MSVIGSNILAGASGQGGGYTIDRSVRLRSSASAYFNRTFGTPTSGNIFTWSGWVKRGAIGSVQPLFLPSLAAGEGAVFNASNQISIAVNGALLLVSTAVYRDPSAWYHIVLVSDMGNATASLRFRVYVNGSEVTAWSTDARASYTSFPYWNKNSVVHYMGYSNAYPAYADGYMTEINFVDGQALTPSDFGETDATTGVWKPKKYVGTYGTNGFYLNFSDNTSTTTLGYDYSGNGNNWTANNISLTSGVTYDSMTDVPTLTSADAGNYCTITPINSYNNTTPQYGNLRLVGTAAVSQGRPSTIAVSSGKWYWEVTATTIALYDMVGIFSSTRQWVAQDYPGRYSDGYGYRADGKKENVAVTTYGATWSNGDVIGVALDLDAGTLVFYKNNSSQGTAFTGISGEFYPAMATYNSGNTLDANFGQRPFSYTPPTGFKALNTFNLPDSTIVDGSQYFDVLTHTGNGGSLSVTGLNFQPDFVWGKARNTSSYHRLHDVVRGSDNTLATNVTDAEVSGNGIVSFDSNGFTLDSGSNINQVYNYVDWSWKAGGTAVSNTDGSITSSVSANTTSGFSIVTYTGTGANATVGHGLGVAPKLVIVKRRSAVNNWRVWHAGISAANALYLNTTDASAAESTAWNSTAPTSLVFSVGTGETNISTSNLVAYCFAEVPGFSKMGSYVGNGSSDGPFIFTGFRPAFVMIKRTDTGGTDWVLLDSSRDPENVVDQYLAANLSDAEGVYANDKVDFLSNGFKQRGTATGQNGSGGTFIFMAFAENPFKYSLAR